MKHIDYPFPVVSRGFTNKSYVNVKVHTMREYDLSSPDLKGNLVVKSITQDGIHYVVMYSKTVAAYEYARLCFEFYNIVIPDNEEYVSQKEQILALVSTEAALTTFDILKNYSALIVTKK